jgi:hypothetical protein
MTASMQHPRQAHLEPSDAPRLHALPSGRCFLGVSTRATPDEAVWLMRGLAQLLPRHDGVLVLLEADVAADLLSGAATLAGPSTLLSATDPSRTTAHILNRWQEIDAVRRRLERVEQTRVQIAAWPHFADAVFATLRDKLVTAFTHNMSFRGDVLRQWIVGQRAVEPHALTSPEVRTECLRQIDALAMRLRVAELSGHHAEYGRDAESLVASRLYAGSYAEDGLTVEALINQPAQRVYRRLI